MHVYKYLEFSMKLGNYFVTIVLYIHHVKKNNAQIRICRHTLISGNNFKRIDIP